MFQAFSLNKCCLMQFILPNKVTLTKKIILSVFNIFLLPYLVCYFIIVSSMAYFLLLQLYGLHSGIHIIVHLDISIPCKLVTVSLRCLIFMYSYLNLFATSFHYQVKYHI